MKNLIHIMKDHINNWGHIVKLSMMNLLKTYKGAALGWLWAIIQPVFTIFVYYFAFTFGLRTGNPVNGYPYILWLISGIIPWFFIRYSVLYTASSIRNYRYLVTKIKFPVSIISTFVNLSNYYINLIMTIIVLGIFVIAGYTPTIYWLQIPIYFIIMFVFFNLLSMLLSFLCALSLDFLHFVRATPIALFWLSGIMYNVYNVQNVHLRNLLLLNPITFIVNGYRNALIYDIWFWERPNELISFSVVFIVIIILLSITYDNTSKKIHDVL